MTRSADHEVVGLTVGDGFKFGCGFALALLIGLLVGLVILTGLAALGIILGLKLPLVGG